jgi:hypothetical protein
MFMNPFSGFRDPNDPFGLLQMAAAGDSGIPPPRPVPTTSEPSIDPALGFPPSPAAPMRTDVSSPLSPPGVTDDRRVPLPPTASQQPEITTTKPPGVPTDERLVPTAASTAPPAKSFNERMMEIYKDPKTAPMIAALAKAVGHGANSAPPVPHALHFADPRMATPYAPQGADKLMGEIRGKLQTFGPKAKKQRVDDPHDREQDTYDFRRLKGRM